MQWCLNWEENNMEAIDIITIILGLGVIYFYARNRH